MSVLGKFGVWKSAGSCLSSSFAVPCVATTCSSKQFSTAAPPVEERSFVERVLLRFAKSYRKAAGYHKYGLRREDIIIENKDIKEAVSRLPKAEQDARHDRMLRAIDASIHNDFLPKEVWTKPEEDVVYLREALEEVKMEKDERAQWM